MLYHAAAYDPAPVDSLWRATTPDAAEFSSLSGTRSCEVAVIGAGYTGLSAALHLARDHQVDVCVLEAAQPGWGASGRNGGFCCPGSARLSYQQMIGRYGLADTKTFFAAQCEAIGLVAELIERENIEADISGQGELVLAHKPSRIRELRLEQDFLHSTFGMQTTFYEPAALHEQGLVSARCYGALYQPLGFGLHPFKYVSGLAHAAARYGVHIYGNSAVLRHRQRNGQHHLETSQGLLRARRLIIAGNGYIAESLHPQLRGRLLPVLSNILVTRPLSESELAQQGWHNPTMAYDSRVLLHYFRLLPDRRFLFGGRGGLSAAPDGTAVMQKRLTNEFHQLFPAWRDVAIDYFWRGLACLAYDRIPHIARIGNDPDIWLGAAYHGNGVAMATWTGRMLAQLIIAPEAALQSLPLMLRRPPPLFPLPLLRLFYLRMAYFGYLIKDEWL